MSNTLENRLDVVMTSAQITAVKTGFTAIETNMPFLIGLTTEERIRIPKMNVSNKVFVEDAINAMVNNPTFLPSYLDPSKVKNDSQLFSQLDELAQICRRLLEKIEDTQMLAGSEAYINALTSYRLFGASALAGVAGADSIYQLLKERFAEQGTGNPSN